MKVVQTPREAAARPAQDPQTIRAAVQAARSGMDWRRELEPMKEIGLRAD